MNTKLSTMTTLMRVVLMKQETYRVTEDRRGLRVRSGQAWVTLNGCDLVLKRGDEIGIHSKNDFAVVSALGCSPLVIELLSENPHPSAISPYSAVTAL